MKFIIFCRFERQFKKSNFLGRKIAQRVEGGIFIGIWPWSFYAANAAEATFVGLGWRKISFEFLSSLLRIGKSFWVRGWGETSRIRAFRMCNGLLHRLILITLNLFICKCYNCFKNAKRNLLFQLTTYFFLILGIINFRLDKKTLPNQSQPPKL